MSDVQVVIAAGGAGTRMHETLGSVPKVIAPVGGRPFLSVVLARLARLGTQRAHLCLGHGATEVLAAVRNDPPDLELTWSTEDAPLGVVGALRQARDWLDPSFVLLYGDVLPQTAPDVLECRRTVTGRRAAMLAWPVTGYWHLPNVALRDGQVTAYAKGDRGLTHIDAGMIALSRDVLDDLPTGKRLDEPPLYGQLAVHGDLAALETDRRPLQIGDPDGYHEMCKHVAHEVQRCD